MEVRRLMPEDAATYRALRLRALKEHPDAFTSSFEDEDKRSVEDAAKRLANAHAKFWGAWDGDRLVGMVGLEREPRAKGHHKAHVAGMYVASESAGAGAGRRVLEALVQGAKSEGITLLVLTVTEGNDRAKRLYESFGFRSFGVEPKAINVDGHFYGKTHMYMELTSS